MSHFTVLVIGEDVDGQLAPYDENLSVEPRRQAVEVDEIRSMLEHYQQDVPGPKTKVGRMIRHRYGTDAPGVPKFPIVIVEGKVVEPDHSIVRALYHQWSDRELFRDDAGYYDFTRYNPQSKWDWYQVGGRWAGYFALKPGASGTRGEHGLMGSHHSLDGVDVLRKGDVDAEAMRASAAAEAATVWDAVHAILDLHPPVVPWAKVRALHGEDIEKARAIYHAQPGLQALDAERQRLWNAGDKDAAEALVEPRRDDAIYWTSRAVWIQRASDGALAPFAYVKDGEWHERGRMGWWACVADEKDADAWHAEFNAMWDALPDDTRLTLVDCHI